jgi:hypothetical protein
MVDGVEASSSPADRPLGLHMRVCEVGDVESRASTTSEPTMAESLGVFTLLKVLWLRTSRLLLDVLGETLDLGLSGQMMVALSMSLTLW